MSSQFHESRGDEGISEDSADVKVNGENTDNHDTTSLEVDPLTSPVWVADDEDLALAPPLEEFEALYEAEKPGGPEPIIVPGVDEIISGEYTGWVPIIGPDTLPDGSTRADQYRVTENVDPIKDAIAKGLEPSAVTGAYEVRKDAVVTKFDDFVDDPDQLVVSPAQALEEARRRIEEMRASLKVNVTEVAATITGEFIPTSQTSTNVVAEPARIETPVLDFNRDDQTDDVPAATMIRDIPKPSPLPHQRIHPIPIPQPPMSPIVEAIIGPEPVFDQNEPTLGVDDVYSSIIFERIAALRIAREQLEAEAQGATSIAAPVVDADEFDTVALNLPKAVNPERDEPGYVTESVSVADEVESAIEEIENFAEEFAAPEIDERINFVAPSVAAPAEEVPEVPAAVEEVDSDVVAEFVAEAEPEIASELRDEVSDIHTTGAYLREILDELKKDNPVEDQVSIAITPPVVAAPISEQIAVEPEVVAPQAAAPEQVRYEDLFGGDFVEEAPTPIFDAVTEIVNLAPPGKHAAPAAPNSEVETELAAEVTPEPQPAREFNQDVESQEAPRIFAQTTQKPTIIMHEEQQSATQLELVIMRDEIQDLRSRLDANQKLVEDLMVRLSDLAMAALTRRD